MRATLWVSKIYDKGLEGYWTWELIIFNSKSPCHAIANLIPQFRFESQKDAIRDGEKMAKLFDIEIDQRAYIKEAK